MASSTSWTEALGRRRLRPLGAARGEAGAALVECALVVSVLALLAVGVVDMGRAYRLQTRLTNAAREGAVYAQYFPTRVDSSGAACADPGNVIFAVRNEAGEADAFNVAVRTAGDGTLITGCDQTAVPPGTTVVVSASTPFRVLTPIVAVLVGSQLTLRSGVEVVVQG